MIFNNSVLRSYAVWIKPGTCNCTTVRNDAVERQYFFVHVLIHTCKKTSARMNSVVKKKPQLKFWVKFSENSGRSTPFHPEARKNVFHISCFMPQCWAIQASSASFPCCGHMLLTQMHHGIWSRPGATVLLLLSKHGWAGAWTGVRQRKARLGVHPHAALCWRFSHWTRSKVPRRANGKKESHFTAGLQTWRLPMLRWCRAAECKTRWKEFPLYGVVQNQFLWTCGVGSWV